MSHLEVLELKQVNRTLCSWRKVLLIKLSLLEEVVRRRHNIGSQEAICIDDSFKCKWFYVFEKCTDADISVKRDALLRQISAYTDSIERMGRVILKRRGNRWSF